MGLKPLNVIGPFPRFDRDSEWRTISAKSWPELSDAKIRGLKVTS